MQAFDNASRFENDFGPTPEGRLIKQLDVILRKPFCPEYDFRVHDFYDEHKDILNERISTHPLYGLAVLRISSVLGNQKLYDNMVGHCLKNYLPWQIFDNGHTTHQNMTREAWLQDSTGKKNNYCKIEFSEKLKLYECLVIDGHHAYFARQIEKIGFSSGVRTECKNTLKRILKKFPENPFVATSLVVLTRNPEERENLAFEMFERFPDHPKLAAITDDINVGQPEYKLAHRPRMYIPD